MISVQNLQQRLSGNKWIVFFLLLTFGLASCGGTNKAVDRNSGRTSGKTKPDKKRTTRTTKPKIDTIEWKEADKDKYPPISDVLKDMDMVKKESYKVSLILPLEAREMNNQQSSGTSFRFVNYYAGVKLALDELNKEGVKVEVNVYDCGDGESMNILLRRAMVNNTDLVIGPYEREDVKKGADYAKDKEIPIVSPWQASNKIAEDNPYYIQLRPNLTEHYFSIMSHVARNFKPDEVVILTRQDDKDINRRDYFIDAAKSLYGSDKSDVIRSHFILEDSLSFMEYTLNEVFTKKTKAIIIPNWSFSDEDYIYAVLRKLSVDKGLSDVYVYGMPIMMESEKIGFDFYRNLNMRVARSKFVDETMVDVKQFKRIYFQKYSALPTDDAYEGYDNMLYLGRALYKYGKTFQYFLELETGPLLQAAYNVQKTFKEESDGFDQFDNIKFFENKHVDIIEFFNDSFRRAKS